MSGVLEKSQRVIQELDEAIQRKTQDHIAKSTLLNQSEDYNKAVKKREKLTGQFQQYTEQQQRINNQAITAFQKLEQKFVTEILSSFDKEVDQLFSDDYVSEQNQNL